MKKAVLIFFLLTLTGCATQRAWIWEQIGKGADEEAYNQEYNK